MRHDTADPYAVGYAGQHDGFRIFWAASGTWQEPDRRGVSVDNVPGWYVECAGDLFGPHETSQAAFCVVVQCIDKLVETGQ